VEVSGTGWWTIFAHPFELTQFTVANYERVLTAEGLFGAFINSLIVTVPATVIPITLAAFAAYGFAWTRFRGRSFLFAVVVGLLVVPLQMSLVPLLRLYGNFDLVGTFVGVWLAHTGFGLPLAIYLLYNYISQLPKDIFESAYIDGATPFTAFTRLVLPLSFPALASFAIFQFLWVWNDLLVSLVFLGTNPDVAVLTARVSQLVGSRGAAWHLLTAGAFVSMVVPLIVFLALQRFFVRGLLAGSVKG
jgi:alpha-glucoside transport system permease protein